MFGKKDGFKYEVEVKALIREATEGLNQRIFALEMQNNQLIQRSQALEGEIYQLKNGLCNDLARLEKRITDFTDVWHPMMMANINRIKADLEKTIMEAEREDIKKVQEDLESKMVKILDEREKYIIIGNRHCLLSSERITIPIFCLKYDSFNNNIIKLCTHNIYLNQIKKLSGINFIDLKNVGNIQLESGKNLTVCIIREIVDGIFNRKLGPDQLEMIETLLTFTNDTGIKLYFNNSEFNQQGVSIKQLLENIITKYK